MRYVQLAKIAASVVLPLGSFSCAHQPVATASLAQSAVSPLPPALNEPLELMETDRWLREGTWKGEVFDAKIGGRFDVLYHFERTPMGWLLHRADVRHPPRMVHAGKLSARPTVRVTADGTWLRLFGDEGTEAFTYRFDRFALSVGCPLETSPRSWVVGMTRFDRQGVPRIEMSRVSCLVDPSIHSEGPAEFPEAREPGHSLQSFVFEEEPGPLVERAILFQQYSDDGTIDAGRLVWHGDGTIRAIDWLAEDFRFPRLARTELGELRRLDMKGWPALQGGSLRLFDPLMEPVAADRSPGVSN